MQDPLLLPIVILSVVLGVYILVSIAVVFEYRRLKRDRMTFELRRLKRVSEEYKMEIAEKIEKMQIEAGIEMVQDKNLTKGDWTIIGDNIIIQQKVMGRIIIGKVVEIRELED